MSNDNSIIISHSDSGTELLASALVVVTIASDFFLRAHITKRSEGKIQKVNAINFIFAQKNSYKTPFFEIL